MPHLRSMAAVPVALLAVFLLFSCETAPGPAGPGASQAGPSAHAGMADGGAAPAGDAPPVNQDPAAGIRLSPPPGVYPGPVLLSIASDSPGIELRYRIGDAPAGADDDVRRWTRYEAPVPIESDTTIRVAVPGAGEKDTGTVLAVYTITGQVAPPAMEAMRESAGGTLRVRLYCATQEAGIRYTLDGSIPTPRYGTLYSGVPIVLDTRTSVKAVAFRPGWKDSAVGEAEFAPRTPAPVIQPAGGTLAPGQQVSILCPLAGASIRYTTDGSEPSPSNGFPYIGPFVPEPGSIVKARAFGPGMDPSDIVQAVHAVAVSPPRFDPAPGLRETAVLVSMTGAPSGGRIRYTTDGSPPSATRGTLYSGPVRLSATTTLRAVTYWPGEDPAQTRTQLPDAGVAVSPIATATYTFTGSVAPPVANIPPGIYAAGTSLVLVCSTEGAVIRYTTDGSNPSAVHGSVYTGPIAGAGRIRLVAIATRGGWKDSALLEGEYVFVDLPAMVEVAGHSFAMGSTSGDADERPVRNVSLRSFLMGTYEVTQSQFRSVMGRNPSHYRDAADSSLRPVEQVNWFDAIAYCNALSDLAGLARVYEISGTQLGADFTRGGYRLPTEAEWEYAARGGSAGTRSGAPQYRFAGSDSAEAVAWFLANSGGGTQPVGMKRPNALGLYDMAGNVWEWCHDRYGAYVARPGTAIDNPLGPDSGDQRVKRGGSWNRNPDSLRVSFRNYHNPANRDRTLGFRVARTSPAGRGR